MACSVVLMTLNLVDKVSNFNEWQLAAGLVLAAGAEALGLADREKPSARNTVEIQV
jgi:hypothetical protein